MKVVIIGAVAGGMTVARRLRRENKNIEIVLIDKSYHLAPSTCMLPYAFDKDFNEDNLHIKDIQKFEKEYDIKVKIMNEVIDIDEKKKELKVIETGSSSIFNTTYDILVIATGTDAIKLKELNNLNNNVFIFKNIRNLQRLKEKLQSNEYNDITIIGGSVLGLELAEVLHSKGYSLSIIEREKNILPQYDPSIIELLSDKIKDKIKIYTNSKILSSKVLNNGKIELNLGNKKVKTDLVIVTAGNRPNTSFLNNSNIKRDKTGYIYVDEYFRTNNKDIYALGDVILTKEYITQKNMPFGLAGITQRQARFVADNILSLKNKKIKIYEYPGAVKTEIVKIFDYTLGRVGLTEKDINEYYTLKGKGISFNRDFLSIYIKDDSNTPLLNNSSDIYMTGYFEKQTKKLVGIQAFGKIGIDKRLDVAATAIKAGMTAFDLMNLDLTYSPPYNIAKDILNRLGSLALKGDNS